MSTDGSRLTRAQHEMPEDVADALSRQGLDAAYAARPAYQRNDYLGWIGRAKRPETRAKRLAQMLEELARCGVFMNMRWNG